MHVLYRHHLCIHKIDTTWVFYFYMYNFYPFLTWTYEFIMRDSTDSAVLYRCRTGAYWDTCDDIIASHSQPFSKPFHVTITVQWIVQQISVYIKKGINQKLEGKLSLELP